MIVQLDNGRELEIQDGATPEQIDDVISHVSQNNSSFLDRVGKAFDERAAMEQGLADKAVAGQKTETEALGEIAASRVGGPIGDVIGAAIGPSLQHEYQALPEVAQKALSATGQFIGKQYNKIPERGRDIIGAVGNLANLVPAGGAAKVAAPVALDAAKAAPSMLGGAIKSVGTKARISGETAISANREASIREAILPDVKTVSGRKQAIEGGGVGTKKNRIGKSTAYAIADKQQEAAISEALKIKGIKPENLHIENANIVSSEIEKKANSLITALKENDVPIPKRETRSKISKLIVQLQNDEPLLTGDAGKAAVPIFNKVKQLLEQNPGTASGLLQVRKDLDKFTTEATNGAIFSDDKATALRIANRRIRTALNNLIADKVPEVEVRKSLSEQSALYTARDAFEEKAIKQEFTRSERAAAAIDKAGSIKSTAAKAAGLALAGGGALYAPSIVLPAAAAYGVGRAISNPALRVKIGKGMESLGSKLQSNPLADLTKKGKRK